MMMMSKCCEVNECIVLLWTPVRDPEITRRVLSSSMYRDKESQIILLNYVMMYHSQVTKVAYGN